MTTQRDKTLSYRRATWLVSQSSGSLEDCLRTALSKLKTVGERSLSYDGRLTRGVKSQDEPSGGMYLHLTAETPGEAASVVPKAKPADLAVDLKTEKPPSYGEWLDGDAFLYVNDDHVCMCATAIRDGSIAHFMRELFRAAKLPKISTDFELLKVADIGKVKLLHKQGVKEIEIKAALSKASADYSRRKANVVGAIGATSKFIKEFLKKPNDVTPDSLQVILTIKTDNRFKNHLTLGEKNIEEMATDVVKNYENGDDYVIITKTGQKISPNEIFMRSKVSIDTKGKTVDRDKAWKELLLFYNQLNNAGVFSQ